MTIFLAGSAGLRVYIGFVLDHNTAYVTLATPIAALLFFYILAFGVLIGAEFNAAFEEMHPARTKMRRERGTWRSLPEDEANARTQRMPPIVSRRRLSPRGRLRSGAPYYSPPDGIDSKISLHAGQTGEPGFGRLGHGEDLSAQRLHHRAHDRTLSDLRLADVVEDLVTGLGVRGFGAFKRLCSHHGLAFPPDPAPGVNCPDRNPTTRWSAAVVWSRWPVSRMDPCRVDRPGRLVCWLRGMHCPRSLLRMRRVHCPRPGDCGPVNPAAGAAWRTTAAGSRRRRCGFALGGRWRSAPHTRAEPHRRP